MTVVEAPALVLAEPLSLWGGVDPQTGRIVDVHHPQHGANLAGRVVVMRSGRGSSSSASVLAEAARAGTAPAAIVTAEPDLILAIGAAVAAELYGIEIPIAVVAGVVTGLRDGALVRVASDGRVEIVGEGA